MNLYIIYDKRNEKFVAANFMKNDFVAQDTFEAAIKSMIVKNKETEEKTGVKNNLHLDFYELFKTSITEDILFDSPILNIGSDFE